MKSFERQISTSVLVIGPGGSGLRAASTLRWRRWTPRTAGDTRSGYLEESYLLANPDTVQIVTEGAPQGISDLERYGMKFAREEDGRISQ
jgi:succinate dehydrogenase / fumarate reductase flavoprotein subunit